MPGDPLPVWMSIFLSGIILTIIVGFINPYVPKDQKDKAKELKSSEQREVEDYFIVYKVRIAESSYLYVIIIIVLASLVTFAMRDFSFVALNYFGGGVLGYIIAGILTFAGVVLANFILMTVLVVVEDIAIEELKDFYQTHYDVITVSSEDLIVSDTENQNPHN
ncbi:hypothetical protein IJH24_01605 [Candidatus Saccharibacteria bacterium]|nr:hypothetical protein [Candidatus Saccharibacteria bacterium]